MPRKAAALGLAALKQRHAFCVTLYDIRRDLLAGRIDQATYERWMAKDKLAAYCDYPEDPICAAPAVREEDILQAIRENQERIGGA